MILELHGVSFTYKGGSSSARTVFNGLDLSVQSGECVGVIGQEGAGKTTLLQLMNGLLKPDRGTVRIDGTDIWRTPGSIAQFRRRIGFAFQFPEQQFFCESIEDELLYGRMNFGILSNPACPTPDEALESVGLQPAQFLGRSPFTLSMGEARRVALATVLMTEPQALLLDEPTVGLDGNGIEFVVNLLRRMKNQGVTTVLVSHDVDVHAEVASRIIVLDHGMIASNLPVEAIFTDERLLSTHGYRLPEIVRFMAEQRANDSRVENRFYRVNEARTLLRSGRMQ
jgi:energy-coupling factor transporter ATP-binding protein EcfA2